MKKDRRHMTWGDLLIVIALLIIIGWLLPEPARSDDIVVNWTAPTEGETCITGGEVVIDGIRIWQMVADITDPNITSFVAENMKPGEYRYAATAYVGSTSSRMSAGVVKESLSFTVQEPTAYIVAKTVGQFMLLPVGTVPIGTPCNANSEVNGHNAVPASEVTFTGARDVVVVAKCG